jgi:hypothetical protein
LPELGIVIGEVFVNDVAAEADAATASEASEHRTVARISLRTTGRRQPPRGSPTTLSVSLVFAKTVSISRALLSRMALVVS